MHLKVMVVTILARAVKGYIYLCKILHQMMDMMLTNRGKVVRYKEKMPMVITVVRRMLMR